MRVAFASLVIDLEGVVILGVFDEKFEGDATVLAGLKGVAQNIGRVSTAIDGDQLHAGADSSLGRGHALDCIWDGSVVPDIEADRVGLIDDMGIALASTLHFRLNLVVDHLPSTAFDSGEGCARAVIGKALGPEATPVVRDDLTQGTHDIIEGVGFDDWTGMGSAVE